MVLTPRRWRQVLWRRVGPTGRGRAVNPQGDGDNKARSPGRSRGNPLKPLRAGMPGESGEPVVTNSYAFYFACEAAGASSTRHSPRPLNVQKALQDAKLARGVRRDRGGVCVSSRGKKGKLCVWKCTGRVAYSATASPVLSLPLLWGGWREAPGGANSRIHETAPTRHIARAAHDVPPQSELRSSRPHKSGRDKKERASLVSARKGENKNGGRARSGRWCLRRVC